MPDYELIVGKERFAVARRVFYAFDPQAKYNIYYMANTKTLLSAEKLA
jgi:hypothetical protein